MAEDRFEFDVALSFAGEDRAYVEDVALALKAAGVTVFLDSDHLADTWGEDLIEFFDRLFRERARYAMLFISGPYRDKAWPRHERRSALARALKERGPYVLPVRLEQIEIQGLLPTVGYLDANRVGIEGIVKALQGKLADRSSWPDAWSRDHVPRTERELMQAFSEKPLAWEFFTFAGALQISRAAVEGKFLDYELGYAPHAGSLTESETIEWVQLTLSELRSLTSGLSHLLAPETTIRAFGPPGMAGDPVLIRRVADRIGGFYEAMLDWTSKVRGTSVPSSFDAVFEALSGFSRGPIRQYRGWLDDLISELDRSPARMAAGEKVQIHATLTLELDDDVEQAFSEAVASLGI